MALQFVSINHRFKQQEVLHDVSLTVEQGDCYGLLGHNGAGKTTLLRTALGLLKPTSGLVAVDQFDIHAFPREARARVGGLIEYPRFNETWHARKNLSVLARLQGMTGQEAVVESDRVLGLVGLDMGDPILRRKRVRDYSQGMKQRLGIAQALLGRPSYVLLDEPMNGLDPQAIVEMRSLIRRLTQQEHVAVVLSSHQLGEIAGLCNRVAILRQGVLLVEDAMDHLLETDKQFYRLSVAMRASPAMAFLETLNVSAQLEAGGDLGDKSTFLVDLSQMRPAELSRFLLDQAMDLLALAPCDPSLEEVYLRIDSRAEQGDMPRSLPIDTDTTSTLTSPQSKIAPQRPFLRGMQYELTQVLSGFRIAGLFVLPAVFALISISMMFQQATANAEKVGDEVFSTTQMTAFDGVGKGLAIGLPILMVLITGLASQSLSGEQTKGTLRFLLMRPISRMQISLSKMSSLIVICGVSYVLLAIASLGASAYFFDFKDLAELLPNGNLFPLVKKEEMFHYLWPVLWAPMLPLVCYTAIGFALGSWIKNNVGALGTTLGAILILDVGRAFFTVDKYIGWLPSAHLPSPLGGHSFLNYYSNMVQGVSNATNPYAYLSLIAPLVWLVFMVVLAVIGLKRKAG